MLQVFSGRADLRRQRATLVDSGIAGTDIRYRFYWTNLRWLAANWPESLQLERSDREVAARLSAALPLLLTREQATWLRQSGSNGYAALDSLRGDAETDAAFLVRSIESSPVDARSREFVSDTLDATYVLRPGPGTPSRTLAHCAMGPVEFQKTALRRERPNLRKEILIAPRSVRNAPPGEARRLIDLARGMMVTRARDLDAFAYADPRDVRIAYCGAGLAIALNGVLPDRRALVKATYGCTILKNGVPVGYGDLELVGHSAAVAFNTFASFRGAESAWIFARLLATAHHLFGARSFSLAPYQLGRDNTEAIASGAWWFYAKLGFAPREPDAKRLYAAERSRIRANARHRSSATTLIKLASAPLYFDIDGRLAIAGTAFPRRPG